MLFVTYTIKLLSHFHVFLRYFKSNIKIVSLSSKSVIIDIYHED